MGLTVVGGGVGKLGALLEDLFLEVSLLSDGHLWHVVIL